MKSHGILTPDPSSLAAAADALQKRRARMHTIAMICEGAALAIAAIALCVLMASCSASDDSQAATTSDSTSASGPITGALTLKSPTHAVTNTVGGSAKAALEPLPTVAASDTLPPDVSAWGPEDSVEPGAVVQVIAKGSPDVVEMVMWDGIGKKQWMLFDEKENVWRTYYRVPVNGSSDRLGLSVTAKNSLNRWHRVWVFVPVGLPGSANDD